MIDRQDQLLSQAHSEVKQNHSVQDLVVIGVLWLIPFTVFLWFIYGSYFGVNVFASISYFGDDGWCDASSDGLGRHCFGDFYSVIDLLDRVNPWQPNLAVNPYSATALVPFWILKQAIKLGFLHTRVALVLYQIALFSAVSFAFIFALKGKSTEKKAIIFLVIGPLSMPALAVLDRGNSAGFLVPVLLMYIVFAVNRNYLGLLCAVTIAAMIKPHYGLLIVIFIPLRMWRWFFFTIATLIMTQTLSFLIWFDGFPRNIWQWLAMTQDYNNYQSVIDQHPTQISYSYLLNSIERLFRTVFDVSADHTFFMSQQFQGFLGYCITAIIIVVVISLGKSMPVASTAIVCIMATTFAAGTVFVYYSIVTLPIASVLFRNHSVIYSDCDTRSKIRACNKWFLATAIIVSLVWIPVGNVFRESFGGASSAQHDLVRTSALFVPLVWLTYVVFWCIEALLRRRTHSVLRTALLN